MDDAFDFEHLSIDLVLESVENELGRPMTPLAYPLASYINRVYELQDVDGRRLIGKFYRPHRWSLAAVQDEHTFVLDCEAAEIPVIAPLSLLDDYTIGEAAATYFAVFPKRHGRSFEFIDDEDWRRFGRLLGRLHTVGAQGDAPERIVLDPEMSTRDDLDQLLDSGVVPPHHEIGLGEVVEDIVELTGPLFDDREFIRIHGDCHAANILCNADGDLMLIDFDDMAEGPPVQDLWMFLPGHVSAAQRELNLILEGYEDIRRFDDGSLRLIEPLRAMRSIYFLSWLSTQVDDPGFAQNNPEWGSEAFWQREIAALQHQLQVIRDHLAPSA